MRYRNPRSEKQRTLRCYSTSRSGTRTWLVTCLTPSDTVAHQTPPQANRLLRSGLALMNWSTISDTSRERSSSGYVAHIAAALRRCCVIVARSQFLKRRRSKKLRSAVQEVAGAVSSTLSRETTSVSMTRALMSALRSWRRSSRQFSGSWRVAAYCVVSQSRCVRLEACRVPRSVHRMPQFRPATGCRWWSAHAELPSTEISLLDPNLKKLRTALLENVIFVFRSFYIKGSFSQILGSAESSCECARSWNFNYTYVVICRHLKKLWTALSEDGIFVFRSYYIL